MVKNFYPLSLYGAIKKIVTQSICTKNGFFEALLVGTLFCDANKIPYFSFLEFFRDLLCIQSSFISLAFLQHIILQHLATAVKYQGYRNREQRRRVGGGGRCRNILLMQQIIEKEQGCKFHYMLSILASQIASLQIIAYLLLLGQSFALLKIFASVKNLVCI